MKLEDQVVSLELAKELKELGVKQESLFYWVSHFNSDDLVTLADQEDYYKNVWDGKCSAFTVAELGEMLPKQIEMRDAIVFLQQIMAGNTPVVFYGEENGISYVWKSFTDENWQLSEFADTEADARAKMLIYLIENNLITI